MNYLPVTPFEDNAALREELIATYARLTELGFLVGTWGNIAVRLADGLLVTPSKLPLSEMGAEDLVVCSWEGKVAKGLRLPTSEMHLHRLLLLRRPDIGALVHAHSPNASAISCTGASIPVILEDMAQIIGGEVRCASYVPAGRHLELGENAARAIGDAAVAVLLGNHGPVVGGRTLAEALVATEVLEKAAGCFLACRPPLSLQPIPAANVESERERFLYKYGTTKDGAAS
jgi:L-fuculose-phosphate aldolase